ECIAMLCAFLKEIGISDFRLDINTRGVAADRAPAEAVLREYFGKHLDSMCPDCRTRYERNIWRILDCKQPECGKIVSEAPDYVASFSEESRSYFAEVCAALDALEVPYNVNPRLVRGLDYYVHTVFELSHSALGAQTAIAGGGRYELFLPGEKRAVPGVGFAAGVERLLMVREALGIAAPESKKAAAYLVGLGSAARIANLQLADKLRAAGIPVELELEERSFKAQLRGANRSGASIAVIRGDSELEKKILVVKDMTDGTQTEIDETQIFNYITQKENNK
ncbi:MAG: ATP phosphoribosyltransferase regulatory subunit, partial [Lentisphaeria bacterium]|nr:ATP phosphoribosyltransferase regulatory subunit [Lentisphaeria bacterium]